MNNIRNKTNLLEPFLKLSVGMDDMFNTMESISLKSTYPPHDILKITENEYQINVALAGFEKEELNVTLDNGYLVIEGIPLKSAHDSMYIYKGISSREFIKTFKLAEGIEVKEIRFNSGLLSIFLEKINLKSKVKTLEIK